MSMNNQLESEYSGSLKTELTLGLPGGEQAPKSAVKRGFSDTVDLNLYTNSEDEVSVATQPPPAKGQVVGWPPVRSYRKNSMMTIINCKYVKVAVDGAPYLRKLDLQIYTSYQELLVAFQNMFTCLTICNVANESKIVDISNGTEYLPAYEDKDGDWMLVGDVPWNMFVESCKRLRLIKSCEKLKLVVKSCASQETSSSTIC
ncbi:hypothetical protein RD792_012822 [Penstemon davidsonii]|uniref:Auxin-responsive protein n=1 Tax=Penstemon davidsonii TaxID=160366 RepID=A0ABR0CY02_9LAMI|nr:hypothetical protein RD792_012822 [Penstemon davidsonii]